MLTKSRMILQLAGQDTYKSKNNLMGNLQKNIHMYILEKLKKLRDVFYVSVQTIFNMKANELWKKMLRSKPITM